MSKPTKLVRFYPNSNDNTHCDQAVLKMIIKYFDPNKKISIKDLDLITLKKPGMYTWPHAGVIWLIDNGYEVKTMEPFDNKAFARYGLEYLEREFDQEVVDSIKELSDIEQGVMLANRVVKMGIDNKGVPSLNDLIRLLNEDFLVICAVNGKSLNGLEGYSNHSVLLVGSNDREFIFHDPGLPPYKYRRLSFNDFEKHWAYGGENNKTYIAVRK